MGGVMPDESRCPACGAERTTSSVNGFKCGSYLLVTGCATATLHSTLDYVSDLCKVRQRDAMLAECFAVMEACERVVEKADRFTKEPKSTQRLVTGMLQSDCQRIIKKLADLRARYERIKG
jgi:hypothetical protein